MGVYYRGERTGYLHRVLKKKEDGYLLSEQLVLKLVIMDFRKDIETVTSAVLDQNLGLISFDFSLKADAPLHVKGRVEGSRLVLTIESQGRKSESSLPADELPYFNISMAAGLLHDLRPGMKSSASIFDPSTMKQEKVALEVVGTETITVMGNQQEAFKIRGSMASSDFFIWVSARGEVLKEESPLGFMLVKESGESSGEIQYTPDIAAKSAVPFAMRLPDRVSYLKVRVSGVAIEQLDLDGGRQRLSGSVLEIRMEDLAGLKKQTLPGPPDEYLKDSFFISSRSAGIIALAQEIVKDEKDPMKKAGRINAWVFRNIKKVPAVTFPVAEEVLDKKRGDCNEHTTLYVALARAAGIPARMSLGLVYSSGSFFYHAWPEVYAGSWIAVDPTLGQFPADASHIRLIIGEPDRQGKLLPLLGNIRLEGIEYR